MRKGKRQEKPSSFPSPSTRGICYLPTRFTKGPGCSLHSLLGLFSRESTFSGFSNYSHCYVSGGWQP